MSDIPITITTTNETKTIFHYSIKDNMIDDEN